MRFAMGRTAGALALAVWLLGGASAADAKGMASSHTFKGTVATVNQAARTLSVKAPSGQPSEMTFALDPTATIKMGKKTEALGSLKAGDTVTVTYTMQNGKSVAEQIEVASAKSANTQQSAPKTQRGKY